VNCVNRIVLLQEEINGSWPRLHKHMIALIQRGLVLRHLLARPLLPSYRCMRNSSHDPMALYTRLVPVYKKDIARSIEVE
jgi:hypothetical protein